MCILLGYVIGCEYFGFFRFLGISVIICVMGNYFVNFYFCKVCEDCVFLGFWGEVDWYYCICFR